MGSKRQRKLKRRKLRKRRFKRLCALIKLTEQDLTPDEIKKILRKNRHLLISVSNKGDHMEEILNEMLEFDDETLVREWKGVADAES